MPLSSAKDESVNLIMMIIVTSIREQSENKRTISKTFMSNVL